MNNLLQLLLIEDSADDTELILRELRKNGFAVAATRVDTVEELRQALPRGGWDVILSDYSLPAFDGLQALEILTESGLDIPFIIISGAIGEETAVRLMRAGAKDYVYKENLPRLAPVLRRELTEAAVRRERIAAETALSESRRQEEAARSKIEHIIRSVPDGLIVCDEEQRVVLINPGAESLLGLSSETAIQRQVAQVIREKSLLDQILQARIAIEDPVKTHLELSRRDGRSPLVIEARTSRMKDARGEPSGSVTVLRDVTYERELERLKSEFISTAAHELNTPLTSIIGYLELLLQHDLMQVTEPEQQREFLEIAHAKSRQLAAIVDELLDLGRMESGQGMTIHRDFHMLEPLFEDVMKRLRQQAPNHFFELSLPDDPTIRWYLDPLKISKVLENLLENSVKFSPAGSTIRLVADVDGENFHCSVADEGVGIAADKIGKVFDKFYRIDASNTAKGGLGLGLSIVKQIVEAHGGKIRLESTPGKETRIAFTLPRQA